MTPASSLPQLIGEFTNDRFCAVDQVFLSLIRISRQGKITIWGALKQDLPKNVVFWTKLSNFFRIFCLRVLLSVVIKFVVQKTRLNFSDSHHVRLPWHRQVYCCILSLFSSSANKKSIVNNQSDSKKNHLTQFLH